MVLLYIYIYRERERVSRPVSAETYSFLVIVINLLAPELFFF